MTNSSNLSPIAGLIPNTSSSGPKVLEEESSQPDSMIDDTFSPKKILAEEDWGSLDFNPTFIGEYKIPPREPKVEKKKEEEEPKKQSTLSRPLSSNFVATS